MTISTTTVINEIRVIVGDLADQFSGTTSLLKISNELENTLLWVTTNYTFHWNVRNYTTSHTSGVTAIPSNLAKVLFVCDSNNNENYYGCSPEEFYLVQNNTDRELDYDQYAEIPYLIAVSDTTGVESIYFGTLANTPSTLTYNITYTKSTTTVDAYIPDRMRPFLVSFTAAQLLAKLDNPDVQLLQYHTQIANRVLQSEITFSNSRHTPRFKNNPAISPNMIINVNGDNFF